MNSEKKSYAYNLLEANKYKQVMADYKKDGLNSLRAIVKGPSTSPSRKTLCSTLLEHLSV